MSNKLNLQLVKISDPEELNQYEDQVKEYIESISTHVDMSFSSVLSQHHARMQAGNPNNTLAVLFFLSFENEETDLRDINRTIVGFFTEYYREKNVLSVRSQRVNTSYIAQILVYPLNKRVLSTNEIERKGCVLPEFEKYLLDYIEQHIDITFENSNKQKEIINDIKKVEVIPYQNEEIVQYEDDDEELIYDAKGYSSQVQSTLPMSKLQEYINLTLKYFTVGNERLLFKRAQIGEVTVENFMEAVEKYLQHNYELSENDATIVMKKVYSAVFGNYVLDDLLNDSSISDIKVMAFNKIRVKVGGKRMTSNLNFIDEEDYSRFIMSLALRNGLDLQANAICPFTDTTTNPNCIMRFNITTPYINSTMNFYLHIRKVPKQKYTIADLIKYQMMPPEVADYLIHKAKTGRGIVFTGKGASGKTSLMNTLLDKIPYNSSGLVIQESDELFSDKHPDIMFQHIVSNGYPNYSLQDEARNGLLTDLDYFIIGEIKGAEALYFLNAADTGHKCWCSVHSPSSVEAINKLADYVMYESKYDKLDSLYMLKELETIVYMKNFKVHEISEVVGWDNDKKELIYHSVYKI